MAMHPYSSRGAVNTNKRTFSSSNINLYVFYLTLIYLLFSPSLLVMAGLVGECAHGLSFSRLVDLPLIFSMGNIMLILS